MVKVSYLFGAGAEKDYNIPLGNALAFELLSNTCNDGFREIFEGLKLADTVMEWLGVKNLDELEKQLKYLRDFDVRDYKRLINGMIGQFREKNKSYLSSSDAILNKMVYISSDSKKLLYFIAEHLSRISGVDVEKIFDMFLNLLNSKNEERLVDIFIALVSIVFIAIGKDILHELNRYLSNLHEDLSDLLKLDISERPQESIYKVFSDWKNIVKTYGEKNKEDKNKIDTDVVKNIISSILDYSYMIEESYISLFNPKEHISKFWKGVYFQYKLWRIIIEKIKSYSREKNTYYRVLSNLSNKQFKMVSVGTTNYTNFIEKDLINKYPDGSKKRLYYLNGSIFDFYDPFYNEVVDLKETLKDLVDEYIKVGKDGNESNTIISDIYKQVKKVMNERGSIVFPLLITQTPLRPFSSFEMKRRYVDYYNRLLESDVLVIIGFGFNRYDSDVLSIIKEFGKLKKKRIIITRYRLGNPEERLEKAELRNYEILDIPEEDGNVNYKLFIEMVENKLNQVRKNV